MNVKFKKLSNLAVLPTRATDGSAAFDLTCTNITTEINECGEIIIVYHTGLAMEIPTGYVGLLLMRSSIAKKSMSMCNAVGTIDSDYRGEITGKFRNTVPTVPSLYKVGERFAQLIIIPIPDITFEEADELSTTDRGEGGYGSTGNDVIDTDKDVSASTGSQSLPETEGEPTNSETATGDSGGEENVPEGA